MSRVTNRRLLDRKVLLDFQKPFDLIPYYKSSYEKEIFAENNLKNAGFNPQNPQSLIWSQLLNAVRTYFENLITET